MRVAYATQPTMAPNALTGPGQAMKGLGSAIAGLGDAFDAMNEPSDQDLLTSQIAMLDADNESQKYYTEREALLTPEADPDQWHQDTTKGIDEIWQRNRERVSGNPKIQQKYELTRRGFVGRYDVRGHAQATDVKVKREAAAALETFKTTLQRVDPTTPEGKAVYDAVGAQLARVPGLNPEQAKEFLAEQALEGIDAKVAKDPVEALKELEATTKAWDEELRVAPGEAPAPDGASPAGEGGFKPDMRSDLGGPRPKEATSYLVGKLAPGYEQRVGDVKDLHPVTQDRLGAFIAAAEDAGHDIRVVSGYRSPERQAVLWKNAVKKYGSPQAARRWVAPPGGSSHQSGEAVDLQFQDRGAGLGGRKTAAVAWAHANAKKFGLHFPLPHEDWHIEPVEARQGGKRYGGTYAKSESLYAQYAGGTSRMALGGPGSGAEGIKVSATAYSPQKGGDKMEGGYAAARPGPDGKAEVRTLADVAAGRSQYVTIAGSKEQFGKTYTIPEISFVDKNGKTQTLKNVKAVVHDTGSAFKGKPEGRFDIAIDRDATNAQMQKSHGLWKQAGLRFVPDQGDGRMALGGPDRPVAERGFAQFYGLSNAERPEGVQVADAEGRIPQSATPRGDNVIPAAPEAQGPGLTPSQFTEQQRQAQEEATPGQVRVPQGQWRQSSIRTKLLDKLRERMPRYIEQRNRALSSAIEAAEKSAAEGYQLPDPQRTKLREQVMATGDAQLAARLGAAEAAADYTQTLRRGNLETVKGEAQRLREELNQNGGTPEFIARTKAVEGLAANMEKSLSDDSIGWAERAGVLPPVAPITPGENFDVETLIERKAVADQIGEMYGMEYRQFFRAGEEKAQLEAAMMKGGEDMVNMLATMYEAFGDDTPKAVAEIAPKNPEAVRAAYLASTGGDPKAVKDIADTILRRSDKENYQGAPKYANDEITVDFQSVTADLYKDDRKRADEVMATAKAIYENRVENPGEYDAALFRESVELAIGTRKGAGGQVYGGPMTQSGTDWDNPYAGGNTILIPSSIRKDMWNTLLDNITEQDLVAAGHPLPADRTGKPIPILRALSHSDFKQVGPNQYALFRNADPYKTGERGGYLMTASAAKENPDEISTADVVASAQKGGGDLFVLDLDKLTPILRERFPSAFWKE